MSEGDSGSRIEECPYAKIVRRNSSPTPAGELLEHSLASEVRSLLAPQSVSPVTSLARNDGCPNHANCVPS
jgi:hypothetical protein